MTHEELKDSRGKFVLPEVRSLSDAFAASELISAALPAVVKQLKEGISKIDEADTLNKNLQAELKRKEDRIKKLAAAPVKSRHSDMTTAKVDEALSRKSAELAEKANAPVDDEGVMDLSKVEEEAPEEEEEKAEAPVEANSADENSPAN